MPITRIRNAGVLKAGKVEDGVDVTFFASPGHITTPNMSADKTVDGTGCTVMPGLIDAKVDSGAFEDALTKYATYGATTAIDSSSSSLESQAMKFTASDNPGLPYYHASGSAIGPASPRLGSMYNHRGVQAVATPEEARRLVEAKIVSHQADFIKVIVDQPGLDMDVIAEAVKEAHRHGKLAVAHASLTSSYELAVDAGFDILTPVPTDGQLSPDLIRRIVQRGIGIIPTLCLLEKLLPLQQEHYPEETFAHALAAVRALDAAGARICAGSSANNWDKISLPFGQGLHNEVRLLASAGLSNERLIRSVTSEPVSLFGLSDRGVIEYGRSADLILVEGNPLENIDALSRIRTVWIRGVQTGE